MADERETLASEIVTLIQTNYAAVPWPEIDQALGLASHQVKLLHANPPPPPEPVVPPVAARSRLS